MPGKNPPIDVHKKRIRARIDRVNQQAEFLQNGQVGGTLGSKLRKNPKRLKRAEREKFKDFDLFLQQMEAIYNVKLSRVSVDEVAKSRTQKPTKKGTK